MKIAVVGSRSYSDLGIVTRVVARLKTENHELVTGTAEGVDKMAESAARLHGIPALILEREAGQSQGDHHQAKLDACDRAVIFWDGQSEGCRDMIDRALSMGIPCTIHVNPR